jgi:PPOX class probable F420-dependent enzyme
MPSEPLLSAAQRTFLESARRAVLATIAPDGHPRLVPICFVVAGEPPILYTPIDDKPKRTDDPLALARIRDIDADPRVTILVDRWDEDWTRLAWLRCIGSATVMPPSAPDHPDLIAALRAKYPPYAGHRLEVRPLIRVRIQHVTSWSAIDERRQ